MKLVQILIYYSHPLRNIPENLPEGLISLNCSSTKITILPKNLPRRLQTLYTSFCPLLTSLPENLPRSILSLNCYNCPNLEVFLKISPPPNLKTLTCSWCPKLKSLPKNLPDSLIILSCDNCPILESLSDELPHPLSLCYTVSIVYY